MIDSLIHQKEQIQATEILKQYQLENGNFAIATFHRPSNVDDKKKLNQLVNFINEVSSRIQLILPLHPRTRNRLESFELMARINNQIILSEPLSYISFLSLIEKARLVITDSGGIQEETSFLKIPCVTVRDNTERPVTVEVGTNYLAGTDFNNALNIVNQILNNQHKKGQIPELWDGKTAERIYQHISHYLNLRP